MEIFNHILDNYKGLRFIPKDFIPYSLLSNMYIIVYVYIKIDSEMKNGIRSQ